MLKPIQKGRVELWSVVSRNALDVGSYTTAIVAVDRPFGAVSMGYFQLVNGSACV